MITLALDTRPVTSFRRPLILEYIDGKNWRLVEAFIYEVGHLGSGEIITIPVGQETDFASIPPPISWLWPPAGASYGKAAVVHDYLYRGGVITLADGSACRPSRKQADEILKEGAQVLGCPAWKRQMIYRAVRLFGGLAYRK